jgi:hypothetical protein
MSRNACGMVSGGNSLYRLSSPSAFPHAFSRGIDNVYNPAVMDFKLYPCRAIADIPGSRLTMPLAFCRIWLLAMAPLSGQAIYPARFF